MSSSLNSSKPAIEVNGLSKLYRLGHAQVVGRTFREAVVDAVTSPLRNLRDLRRLTRFKDSEAADEDTLWALRDISFSVQPGEVIGVVGHNGAGKSTLLKILSRITEPSAGEAIIRGRVGSLLEVGTGFHSELTGRENIFLNGSILGMTKSEIGRKFDEIVAFAEVERFLDTPVKRYSSGMYLRLAFSVAAHLEPEILLVDEVLAVGDASFQEKCLGKMGAVSRDGRTILFVSHNLSAIWSLCPKTIWLNRGGVQMMGDTDAVLEAYRSSVATGGFAASKEHMARSGSGRVRLSDLSILNEQGDRTSSVPSGSPMEIVLDYESSETKELQALKAAVVIVDERDTRLFSFSTGTKDQIPGALPPNGRLTCSVPRLPLVPGSYALHIAVHVGTELSDKIFHALNFEVIEGDYFGNRTVVDPSMGRILVDHGWSSS